jgi:glycosyltransferase involved in cell wall biosynthesis
VIPNGIETAAFARTGDRARLRAEWGVRDDQIVIGSIGRLEPVKGFDVMLEAFARLRQAAAPAGTARLVIAGDGSQREALEAQASRLGISEHVQLLGWRDDVHDLHAAFDLFTLSSRSEGMSISLLEAMSAGLCPVVTDVGGNAEVLGPELQGLLAGREEPALLARAWEQVLSDPRQRAARASAAQARARSQFDVSLMVSRYEALYAGGPVT